jgi:hypothetical protein
MYFVPSFIFNSFLLKFWIVYLFQLKIENWIHMMDNASFLRISAILDAYNKTEISFIQIDIF